MKRSAPFTWLRALAHKTRLHAWNALWLGTVLTACLASAASEPPQPPHPSEPSRLIEAAGLVHLKRSGTAEWMPARVGIKLQPGDRLRTGAASRAAVLLSDRSVVRLNERSLFELQPPRHAEKHRFGLLDGLLYFFNRERPADIEFETPLAAGTIRGTEFVLHADSQAALSRITLLDGRVEWTADGQTSIVETGEQAVAEQGRGILKSPVLDTIRTIQWALYYPAVLDPADLDLSRENTPKLAVALARYREGDLPSAIEALRDENDLGPAARLFKAALGLAVGQVAAIEEILARSRDLGAAPRALRELIQVVRAGGPLPREPEAANPQPGTASEWMARSYRQQGNYDLQGALASAQQAIDLAPDFGFAHLRAAELHWMLDRREQASKALQRALATSPRHPQAWSLKGFIALEQDRTQEALTSFHRAVELDPALGVAWLGLGLAEMQLGNGNRTLENLQLAVALEPRRSLHRSYLGKAFSQAGLPALAEKELRLARHLDDQDPTPWFYSALHQWRQNRPNQALSDLEASVVRNDNRQIFRSRLGLDRDLAVRQADLATLYRDANLPEAGLRAASHAVADDYLNFAGHLFLANSYRGFEDPARFDLRYESARQSEWLIANLLAPPGGANLSQWVSQQESLRFFEGRLLGMSSWSRYESTGNWIQEGSVFGTIDGLSYALDAAWRRVEGPASNDSGDRLDASVQVKQRLGFHDEIFLQLAFQQSQAGDVSRLVDPTLANPGLQAEEQQWPNLVAGWHHAWSPDSHTLALFSHLTDQLELNDPLSQVLFLRHAGNQIVSASTPPLFALNSISDVDVYSAEIQQVVQSESHTWVGGVRGEFGSVRTDALLTRSLSGKVAGGSLEEPIQQGTVYLQDHWRLAKRLRLIGGISYQRFTQPANVDFPPLTAGTVRRDQLSPRAGVLWEPWTGGQWRLGFSRSLGGQYFEEAMRLEPAQVVGFPHAFRSLLPESAGGLIPGTRFQAVHAAIDQRFGSQVHAGIEGALLESEGDRLLGVLTNSLPLPIPDSASSILQSLRYQERALSLYSVLSIGQGISAGARYRITHSDLQTRFPGLPQTLPGLTQLAPDREGLLQEASLSLRYLHESGFLAEWETRWLHQQSAVEGAQDTVDDLWQHDAWVGYRWPARHAELRLGVLNITDADYRLHPLNPYPRLPRERTLAVSLRLNF